MIGPRPTIGWLGYLVIGRSPFRFAFIMAIILLLGLFLIQEAKQTLTLKFQQPAKYPPPVIILATVDKSHLTPLDACGVEAASLDVEVPSFANVKSKNRVWQPEFDTVADILKTMRNPMNNHNSGKNETKEVELTSENIDKTLKQMEKYSRKMNKKMQSLQNVHEMADEDDLYPDQVERIELEENLEKGTFRYDDNSKLRRDVYVYLWTKTIFKGDKWTHFIERLPRIHLHHMDGAKVMRNTPTYSWSYKEGLSLQSPWISWIAAAVGTLYKSGGFVMPMGVVLTKPLAVTSFGTGTGVLAADTKMNGISAVILGAPPRHAILKQIIKKIENDPKYTKFVELDVDALEESPFEILSPLNPLLSDAVNTGCGASDIPYLYVSDCGDFTLIPSEDIVSINVQTTNARALPDLKTLLYFEGNPTDISNDQLVNSLFTQLKLKRFCPAVAKELQKDALMTKHSL